MVFFLFNQLYFSDLSTAEILSIFLYGLRFDLSVILMINSPLIVFYTLPFRFRIKKAYMLIINTFFLIINSIAIAVNLIDVIYFKFTFKRTTADILNYLGAGDDFTALIPVFIKDFWYICLIWIALIILLIYLFKKVRLDYNVKISDKIKYYIFHSLIFLITIFFTIIGIRGGFQLRPLSIMVAGKYTNSKNVPLVLNTPYTFLTTINKSNLLLADYYDSKTLEEIYTPYHRGSIDNVSSKKNIVIIIIESLSLEHIGSLNTTIDDGKYKGYTPFLDSLIGHSLVYKGFANGKRSIEGLPAILSGIPSLMNNAFITSPYAGNNINSIASLLKEKSYYSSFFHGGNNGTMGFDNYTKMAGFDSYYGRDEYNNEEDFDGKWGIFDEEFLQFTAKEINTFEKPFVATIFTLSSHHPYTIPEKHKGKFRNGNLEIQKSIQYTDYSLKRFFKTSSELPWFKNTIFVITADHTSEAYNPFYTGNVGMYAIPIIFFDPDSNLNGVSPLIAQQIDILPSLLEYINYDEDYIAFGTSVFDSTALRFSINYLNNYYQLIMDDHLLQFDGKQSIGLYNIINDSLLENNLLNNKMHKVQQMERFTKAVIQQYNNRLIENRLTR